MSILTAPLRLVPGADRAGRLISSIIELPTVLDELAGALGSLERLADLEDTLKTLGTFDQSLASIATIADSVERLAASVESLPELTAAAASLPELTAHAASLPELTAHAAALPELSPRVATLEGMVAEILEHLDTLRPAVTDLTAAASDLHRAVGPIGRIAGRLPGSKVRPEGKAPALVEPAPPAG